MLTNFEIKIGGIMPKSNKQPFLPRTRRKLITAVTSNNISVTEALLKQGANPNQMIAANGGRLLHMAARYGFLAIVDLLLQHGAKASINIKNKFGYTPLHEILSTKSASENHEAIILLLLQHGADLFITDNLKQTSLQLILQSRHVTLRELFSKIIRKLLKTAVINNHVAATKLLLGSGIDPNQTDNTTGYTLLHLAVQYDALEVAALLLRHGADVDKSSNCGSTALHYAASNNHIEMATLLLNYTSSLLKKDNAGKTPGNLAAYKGYLTLAKLLHPFFQSKNTASFFPNAISKSEPGLAVEVPKEKVAQAFDYTGGPTRT